MPCCRGEPALAFTAVLRTVIMRGGLVRMRRECVGVVVFILVLAPHITHTLRFLSSALSKTLTTARACLRASGPRMHPARLNSSIRGRNNARQSTRTSTYSCTPLPPRMSWFHRGPVLPLYAFAQIYTAFSHVQVAFMPCVSHTLCERWKAS